MRNYLVVFLMLFSALAWSQDSDTTVYVVAEEPPIFGPCSILDTTPEAKKECSQQMLLATVYSNVQYPLEARQNGNEGQVVVAFVVEKDSTISSFEILRDIGGGCGQSVVNVLSAMNDAQLKWLPGRNKGEVVRVRQVLPVKFKLEEAPPYVLVDRDTIYTKYDTPLDYKEGSEALLSFIKDNLVYPESAMDSCAIGNFEVQMLVDHQGTPKVLGLTDYNNLGFDFWSSISDVVSSTYGKWNPAVYKERPVPAAFDISVSFFPKAERCKAKVDLYSKAVDIANEGSTLYNDGNVEEGLAKLSEAVSLFPNDGNFLLMRGQAYLDAEMYTEACEDLTKGIAISSVTWFDSIMPIICNK